MEILLINPPVTLKKSLGIGEKFVQKYEPLGLLYIAAVVREKGYSVSVIDAYAEELSLNDLKEKILSSSASIIGISTITANGSVVYELGRWTKQACPDTLVVLGNIHAEIFAQAYLENNCCDIVIHGEGEYTFLKIIDLLLKKTTQEDIPGISFIDKHRNYIYNGPPEEIKDLSCLPFPARDLVKQKLYNLTPLSNQIFIGGKNIRAKTIITSRGCPHRCNFCVIHRNQNIRYNDPLKVVDELEILEKEYAANYVYFMDPLFMGNHQRLTYICEGMIQRKLKMRWGCDTHVNYINREVIKMMEQAGCYDLSLGIESGVQRLLDTINKKTTISQIKNAIHIIRKNSRIFTEGLFILGIPGESYGDSLETIRFAQSLPLDMAQFSILMPYPGSPFFEELRKKGEIDTGVNPDGTIHPQKWEQYSSYICFSDVIPIWVTPTLSVEELRTLQKKAFRDFYFRPIHMLHQMKRIRLSNFAAILEIAFHLFKQKK